MDGGWLASGLRAIILSHIVDENTRDVILEATRQSTVTVAGPGGGERKRRRINSKIYKELGEYEGLGKINSY